MTKSFNFWKLIALGGFVLLTVTSLEAAPARNADVLTAPRLSPPAQTGQVIGMTGVHVAYGRPAVQGRPIWGKLVSWDQVWRTGADDPTVITISDEVMVEGHKLAAGTYALFTIPGKKQWTVIFNKNHQQWGAFSYSEDDDVLRVQVRPRKADHQERMTIDFPEVSDTEAVMRLRWEKIAVPITLQASLDSESLISNARRATEAGLSVNHLWEWTAYMVQKGVTVPEMPGWVDRILETYPGFYATQLKAQVLAEMGRAEEAVATGQKALEMGEAELGSNQFLTRAQLDQFSADVKKWRAGAD